jgi:hypothetical protein
VATLVLLTATLETADAEVAKRNRALHGEIWETDVHYYAATDTYFQLIDDKQTNNDGANWAQAASAASQRSYNGRKGRLAIIDNPNLQTWIIKKFNISALIGNYGGETWIGLRYMCNSHELWTVNGERYPRTAFTFWDVPWYRSHIRCDTSNIPYMGVYIRAQTNRWQASGVRKRFVHYLVEYPVK